MGVLRYFVAVQTLREWVTGPIKLALSAWEPTWYGESTVADSMVLYGADTAWARD